MAKSEVEEMLDQLVEDNGTILENQETIIDMLNEVNEKLDNLSRPGTDYDVDQVN